MQEDVLERAKKAKERAAREAMEAQGLVSKSTTTERTTPAADRVNSVTPSSVIGAAASASPSSRSGPTTPTPTALSEPDAANKE
jgi:hypothetical protein